MGRSQRGAPGSAEPLSFDRERALATAALLRASAWLTVLGACVYEVFLLSTAADPVRIGAVAGVGALAALALWLLGRGLLVGAAWLVTSVVFGIACLSMWLNGGVDAPGVVTLMILLVMAAMALAWQPAVVWAVLSVLAVASFGIAESQGWLPAPAPRRVHERAFIYLFHLAAATWLVMYSARAVRGILGRLAARTEELAASEARYARLVEQSPDTIVVLDATGRIVDCSSAIEARFGYRPEEVIGRSFRDIGTVPEELFEHNDRSFARLMSGDTSSLTEARIIHRDGSVRWVEANPRVVRSPDGSLGLHLVIRDTTERVKAEQERAELERQLVDAGRLEALGRMAGGIAHDFNNLLHVVLSNTELLEARASPVERPLLRDIRTAGEAAAGLTSQLLAFAGRQHHQADATDVATSLSKVERLMRRVLPSHVDLVVEVEAELPAVRGDPAQLERVLANLVMNARDAMPRGGAIRVEAVAAEIDEHEVARAPERAPGAYVRISVVDTGPGMDEDVARRAFEPFYTTRRGGTGLGLAIVHGIVRQCGGHVRVHTRPGEGTRFDVWLPVAPAATSTTTAHDVDVSPVRAPREAVVLIVDDEPTVLHVLRRQLDRQGFRVLAADGLDAARRAIAGHPVPIDVLVTDVTMPAISGPELALEILRMQPGIKVLLMSGYAEDDLGHVPLPSDAVGFIAKPFTGDAIAREIRRLLGAPPPSQRDRAPAARWSTA